MARCVIVSACPVSPAMGGLLQEKDFIIACDAGYRNCEVLGRRPDVVVGDFDSAPRPEDDGEELVVLPHVKDDTDTEYAARLAAQDGYTEALLLGTLGGKRLEHTIANLCTGYGLEKRGIRTELRDERTRITYLMPGEKRVYPKREFFYLSAFPLEGRADGVTIKGAFYELENAELTAAYPLAVSNEYAEGSAAIHISVRSGGLLIVETLAD